MSWPEVTSIVAAMIVFSGTFVGVRATRASSTESNRTEEWHRLLTEHKSWQDVQQSRIERLERRLDDVEEQFELLRSKYWVAVRFIRRTTLLVRRYVPSDEVEDVPDDIRADV